MEPDYFVAKMCLGLLALLTVALLIAGLVGGAVIDGRKSDCKDQGGTFQQLGSKQYCLIDGQRVRMN